MVVTVVASVTPAKRAACSPCDNPHRRIAVARHGGTAYLGCTVGSPPGVPGGGITGVVFGVGSGAGAWIPGSTPAGGRTTPRVTPDPSWTMSLPVGPPPRGGGAGSTRSGGAGGSGDLPWLGWASPGCAKAPLVSPATRSHPAATQGVNTVLPSRRGPPEVRCCPHRAGRSGHKRRARSSGWRSTASRRGRRSGRPPAARG